MRILVTGASGYVGSHAAATLIDAGHQVVALARTPARVRAALSALGVDDIEIVEGDMTDDAAVTRALAGCDAVLHAAAQTGVGGGTEIDADVNVEGVRQVVGRAIAEGCDPIIYTSTITVHVPCDDEVIGPDSRFVEPSSVYGRSKVDCERLVAAWQAEGAPIANVVLGAVYGPVSPNVEGSTALLQASLSTMAVAVDGGMPVVDVRDVSALFVALMTPGSPPRRLLAGGTFVTWREMADHLERIVGREVPRFDVTVDDLVSMGRDMDEARAAGRTPAVPMTEEAAMIMTSAKPTDDGSTWSAHGIEPRQVEDTFRDHVTWMVEAGHLDPGLVSDS